MRTAAIAAVILCHLGLSTYAFTFAMFYVGVWGVDCFFVLSGLLLGTPYIRALLFDKPLPEIGVFYRRRFYRIYPLYIATVILSIPLVTFDTGRFPHMKEILAHVLMIQAMSVKTVITINGPMWTMGIDALFYLLLPLLAFSFAPIVRGRSKDFIVRAIVMSLAVISLSCVLYRIIALMLHPDTLIDFRVELVYVRNLFGFALSFCLGFAIALASIVGLRVTRPVASAFIVFGVALGVMQMLSQSDLAARTFAFVLHYPGLNANLIAILSHTILDPIAACSSAAILFGILQLQSQRLTSFTDSKIVTRAATIAYAVYLTHFPIFAILKHLLTGGRFGIIAFSELFVAGSVFVMPIAYALHLLIERPFLTMNERQRTSVAVADLAVVSRDR